MDIFLQAVGPAIGEFGAPVLLAWVTVWFFTGRVMAKPTVDKLLLAKDEKFQTMEAYYEKLLASSGEAHNEIRRDLRETADKAQQALGMSVNTMSKLVAQQDELMELSRTATPALIARTEVTSNNDRPRR